MEAKKVRQHLASISTTSMTILTLIHAKINSLKTNILYGSQQIPTWHFLYNKKCWRCGWYERKLILYDKTVLKIIIYRFYCPETRKTYSLRPFFIKRYERHINTVIEDVLKAYFLENIPVENLAEEPSPSPWTIRRWLSKFQGGIDATRQKVEEFLIANVPQYRSQASCSDSIPDKLSDLFRKAELLPIADKNLFLYGSLSYLNYATTFQNSKF